MMDHRRTLIWIAMLSTGIAGLRAQVTTPALPLATTTVRGRVQIIGAVSTGKKRHEAIPATVVWLTPVASAGGEPATAIPSSPPSPPTNLQLVQKNKSFQPHILVVPAG